jgi:hypothetical protein
MNIAIKALIASLAVAIASPAFALDEPVAPCDALLTNPDALDCAGYYSGNLINESDVADQMAAIASLDGDFVWDGNWNALDPEWKIVATEGDSPIDFGVDLFGLNIIGAHFGNVAGQSGNVSVFWLIDFGTEGGRLTLDDSRGWSNAVLYTPPVSGVPEPSTWAMMLFGFGAAGMALRRGTRRSTHLSQIA